jgi:hypothetical protein
VIVVLECIGPQVRLFQRLAGEQLGDPIFTATVDPTLQGTVALFSNGASNLRFSEIRVDDLRESPSTAYRFDFITSKYTNFYHHLHSFDDQLTPVPVGLGLTENDVSAELGNAISVPTPTPPGGTPPKGLPDVTDAEQKAFARLEQKVLDLAAVRQPERIEVLRVGTVSSMTAFLIRSPEPLVWARTALAPSQATSPMVMHAPGIFKLSAVSFGSDPSHESVTILVRSPGSLSNFAIQWRPIPDPTTDPNPLWTNYFVFGDEPPLQDGTQVRIFSGTAANAPARDPGTTQRFAAATDADAHVQFAAPGVELRLFDLSGNIVHQREFRTDDAFTPLAMSAIRKVDGTAMFLLLPTNAPVVSRLRLAFTLTRNFGDDAPDAPVLRQAGSDQPEVVVVDVPPGT